MGDQLYLWDMVGSYGIGKCTGESPETPHVQRAVHWLKRSPAERTGAGERIMTPTGMATTKGRVMPALPIKPRGHFWASCQLGKSRVLKCEKVSITSFARRRGTDCGKMTGFLLRAFPRVLYLKYGGYYKYFPLWALARYRNLYSHSH